MELPFTRIALQVFLLCEPRRSFRLLDFRNLESFLNLLFRRIDHPNLSTLREHSPIGIERHFAIPNRLPPKLNIDRGVRLEDLLA